MDFTFPLNPYSFSEVFAGEFEQLEIVNSIMQASAKDRIENFINERVCESKSKYSQSKVKHTIAKILSNLRYFTLP